MSNFQNGERVNNSSLMNGMTPTSGRKRGRPKGSVNKSTLAKRQQLAEKIEG